ncbi:hypothetical protein Scep_011140 [Stephania cephalantha]|uniref:Leucine-rich repeat-containing N-terminal plant-type domain-containing protein n=1 Tax=Stephania cephalantha TaxID=152367 RepID=A0AAP0JES9_9MAGN
MAVTHLLLLLLLFFFSIAYPSHQQRISTVDLSALIAIKSRLADLPRSNFFSSWTPASPDPCSTFSGVTCALQPSPTTGPPLLRVTSLSLGTGLADSPGLIGSLSPALSSLSALTQLILYPGIVSGPIPPQLGSLKSLRVISLTNNRLTGPIPDSLATLPNLHTLDLSHNHLSGSLPPGLTKLPNLKVLVLASNRLSAELPPVSTQLLHLDLKQNGFSGQLPLLPPSLRYFSVSENLLTGTLDRVVLLPELIYLDLSMNQFVGPVPESLIRCTLSTLLLQRNNLSGGIPRPSGAVDYEEGSMVDLSHNLLSGELSPVLAGVEMLFLNNNRLIGIVPAEYVDSVYSGSMKTLYLQHNYFTGFPLRPGAVFSGSPAVCLSYNCVVPPIGLATCPVSAGVQLLRPAYQCENLKNGSINE